MHFWRVSTELQGGGKKKTMWESCGIRLAGHLERQRARGDGDRDGGSTGEKKRCHMSVSARSGSVPASLIGTSGREDASQMESLSFRTQHKGFGTDLASEGALFVRHLFSVFFFFC